VRAYFVNMYAISEIVLTFYVNMRALFVNICAMSESVLIFSAFVSA